MPSTSYTDLPTPTKSGYYFAGWYYDSGLTKKVEGTKTSDIEYIKEYDENNCPVYKDITLYAKWEKLSVSCETKGGQYTLSYNTNGGNAIASVKVPIAMPSTSYTDLPTPTKSGYYFAGWYYDSGLTKKVEGTKTSDIEYIKEYDENNCPVYKDITLYAKWENLAVSCETKGGQYTLSYNTNGGNAIASVKVPIAMPSTSYTDLPTPTKSGYYFAGWYYDSGLTKKVEGTKTSDIEYIKEYDEDNCPVYKDITLYAKWDFLLTTQNVMIAISNIDVENIFGVDVKPIENITNKIKEKFSNVIGVYDINLLDEEGNIVQPNGNVKVIIPITEEIQSLLENNNISIEDLVVYRIENDDLIEYSIVKNGNNLEFETNHFSVYAIGFKETKNPETFDNIGIYFIVALILSFGCLVTFKKVKSPR